MDVFARGPVPALDPPTLAAGGLRADELPGTGPEDLARGDSGDPCSTLVSDSHNGRGANTLVTMSTPTVNKFHSAVVLLFNHRRPTAGCRAYDRGLEPGIARAPGVSGECRIRCGLNIPREERALQHGTNQPRADAVADAGH